MARSYVILVNWKGLRDTVECLESLLRLDDEDFEIIIVDNGSADGSIEGLKQWAASNQPPTFDNAIWRDLQAKRRLPASLQVVARRDIGAWRPGVSRISVVEAGENLGFAAANNLGMALASKDPASEYFWVLNNDTVVLPESLSKLVSRANANLVEGIIGAALIYYHDPKTVQGLGGWIEPRRAKAGHIGAGIPVASLASASNLFARIDYVMGASMFVRRGVYEATGGMSEDYFLYYEELDWARRLPSRWRLGICLDAIVYHKEGGSIGTSSVKRPSDTALYYLYNSSLKFYWRFERLYSPVLVARIVSNLVRHALARDWGAIRVGILAASDAATNRGRSGPFGSEEFLRQKLRSND